jgi:outer membrane protein TolC
MNIRRFIILIPALYSVIATGAHAQEPPLTLDQLRAAVQKANPSIAAARSRWEAAQARVGAERSLDKPQLTAEYWDIPGGSLNPADAGETMYGIRQMFPFPGKLRARGKAAEAEAQMARWELKDTELRVAADAMEAYAEYLAADRSISVYQENIELMKGIAKIAESQYITGSVPQNDVVRAQVEIARINTMLVTTEQERLAARARVNALRGMPAETELGIPAEPRIDLIEKDWNAVSTATLRNSPDVKKSSAETERARQRANAAQLDYMPDFDLAYRRHFIGSRAGNDLMLGVTVPLWFGGQSSNKKAADRERIAAEQEQKNAVLSAVAEARQAYSRLQASQRRIELYRTTVLVQSQQLVSTSRAAYIAGRQNMQQLLDSVQTLLQLRLDYYTSIVDYYRDLGMLERITGTSLTEVTDQ